MISLKKRLIGRNDRFFSKAMIILKFVALSFIACSDDVEQINFNKTELCLKPGLSGYTCLVLLDSLEMFSFQAAIHYFTDYLYINNDFIHINDQILSRALQTPNWKYIFNDAIKNTNNKIINGDFTAEELLFEKRTFSCTEKRMQNPNGNERPWVENYWWGYRVYFPHREYSNLLFNATLIGGGMSFKVPGVGFVFTSSMAFLAYSYSQFGHGEGAIWSVTNSNPPVLFRIEYPYSESTQSPGLSGNPNNAGRQDRPENGDSTGR